MIQLEENCHWHQSDNISTNEKIIKICLSLYKDMICLHPYKKLLCSRFKDNVCLGSICVSDAKSFSSFWTLKRLQPTLACIINFSLTASSCKTKNFFFSFLKALLFWHCFMSFEIIMDIKHDFLPMSSKNWLFFDPGRKVITFGVNTLNFTFNSELFQSAKTYFNFKADLFHNHNSQCTFVLINVRFQLFLAFVIKCGGFVCLWMHSRNIFQKMLTATELTFSGSFSPS